MITTLILSVNS